VVKRRRIKKRRARKPERRNLTFIIFAIVIFIGSIAGYALLSGGSLGVGKVEAGEPPENRQIAERLKNPFAVDEAFLARGEEIYLEKCATCHYEDGSGPEYHPVSLHARHHSPGDYIWVVTYGIPGSVMKGYQKELTLEERWQVVAYMRLVLAGLRE
jgi:mono/diheme cytochrome c family protein